jgi:S1-C subfamily serine protease
MTGVVVAGLDPRSPTTQRLQVGDIIESINQRPVRSVQEYNRMAAEIAAGDRALLLICRGRTRSYVVIAP